MLTKRSRARSAQWGDPEVRFIARIKVVHTDGCWEWQGAKNPLGYGVVRWGGATRLAHRVAYTLWHSEIPTGLVIDHLCRNPACCNPGHMQATSQSTNVNRGRAGWNMRIRTHCPKGHPLMGDNLYQSRLPHRVCVSCARQRANDFYHRLRN